MQLKDLKQKIENSKEFKELKSQNKEFEPCVSFLILDISKNQEVYSLDYKCQENIFSFSIKNTDKDNIEVLKQEILDKSKKLNAFQTNISEINLDIPELLPLVQKEFEKNKINKKIDKIIAILQQTSKGLVWQLTVIAEAFTIFLINFDAQTKQTLKFEKKSLFDFARPAGSL